MKCLKCGDCCIRFYIDEIDKPAGVRCWHLNDKNECDIYDNRPKVCVKHDYPAAVCPIGVTSLKERERG